MTIRKRIGFLSAIILLVGIIVSCIIVEQIVNYQFEKIANKAITEKILQIKTDINTEINEVYWKATDWASWDDTYFFVQNRNKDYLIKNLTYLKMNVDFMLFLNKKYEVVGTYPIDNTKFKYQTFNEIQQMTHNLAISSPTDFYKGLVSVALKPAIFVALPILRNDNSGPVNGVLVFGRFLDEKQLFEHANSQNVNASIGHLGNFNLPIDFNKKFEVNNNNFVYIERNNNSLLGFSNIADWFGKNVFVLKVVLEEEYYIFKTQTTWYLLIFCSLFSIVIYITTILFFDNNIFKRFKLLTKEIDNIGDRNNYINISGNDEVTQISKKVNELLSKIRQDNEKLKRRSNEILSVENQKKVIINSLPDSMLLVDYSLCILDFKLKLEDNLFKDKKIDIGFNLRDIFPNNQLEFFFIGLKKAITTNNFIQIEFDHVFNGKNNYFEGRFIPIENKEILILIRNITERIESNLKMQSFLEEMHFSKSLLEEKANELEVLNIKLNESQNQLKELNETKDRFFSIIAHDLKTPFTALLGYSEFLMNDIDDLRIDEIREYATNINKVGKSAVGLIDNLLDWSRIQTGRIEYCPQRFCLSEVVEDVLSLVSHTARKKYIEIVTDISDSNVYADKNMVHTVLRNLIANAIKFTKTSGEISLLTHVGSKDITVEIKDSGVGISEKLQDKLFKIGESVSIPGTEKESGTGLGLILCKEFIEINKGRIWFSSEPGVGTSFYFTLPLSNENINNK